MFFFAQKIVTLCQNSVFGEIQFSQKSLTDRTMQPHTFPQQVIVQQTPIISCCYYKPRAAVIPEKETKILKNGARGDKTSRN